MSLEITEEQVRRFQEDGALKIENIFSPEWVETEERNREESGFTESIFREAGCEGRSGTLF